MTTSMTEKLSFKINQTDDSFADEMKKEYESGNATSKEDLMKIALERYDFKTKRDEEHAETLIEWHIDFPYDIEGHNEQVGDETVKLSEIEIEALLHLVEHEMENVRVNEGEVWQTLHENLSNCKGELKVTEGYKAWLLDSIQGILYEGMSPFYKDEEYEDYWNAFCSVYGVDPEEEEEV